MEYDEDTLRRAWLADEAARIQVENQNLFAFTGSRVPSYGIVPIPRTPWPT